MSIIISGFSDEITQDFDVQLAKIKEWGMNHVSLRGIDGKNISKYTVEEFKEKILARLDKEGVKVSSMGSPIGKIKINNEEAFKEQTAELDNLCQMAQLAGCKYIRMFSFFIDAGEDYDSYKDKVIEKLKVFAQVAGKYDVILLHENEKDIFGDIARRCKTIFEEVGSPYFKGVYDFANFVQCGEDAREAYDMLKDHMVYYHIKDAMPDGRNVPFGTGAGKVREILKDLLDGGYDGFLTLEPHLAHFVSKELEKNGDAVAKDSKLNGEQGYKMQYDALIGILKEIGVTV